MRARCNIVRFLFLLLRSLTSEVASLKQQAVIAASELQSQLAAREQTVSDHLVAVEALKSALVHTQAALASLELAHADCAADVARFVLYVSCSNSLHCDSTRLMPLFDSVLLKVLPLLW